MIFDEFGLSPEILRAVTEQGYEQPTPIQEQAIPHVLAGRDLLGRAQTGTGKTAAFALPMLERLRRHANTSFSPARHPIRALILAPTRELAVQDYESFTAYGRHVPLRYAVVYGGVPIEPQTKALRAGVEVLVATPGRLLDHLGQRNLSLATVEVLVLDEADRMLDMGFLPDITRIVEQLPANRQTLLFSATFSAEIRRLAAKLLPIPVSVDVAPQMTARPNWSPRSSTWSTTTASASCWPSWSAGATCIRCSSSRAPSCRRDASLRSSIVTASPPSPFTAIAASPTASARWPASRPATCRCSWRPTSPRAASTSRRCRWSSTTSCRTPPTTTCIASAAPAAPAPWAVPISLVAPDEEDYLKAVNLLLKRDLPCASSRVSSQRSAALPIGAAPASRGARRPPAARSARTPRPAERRTSSRAHATEESARVA